MPRFHRRTSKNHQATDSLAVIVDRGIETPARRESQSIHELQVLEESATAPNPTANWRSLFAFTTRQHTPSLVFAGIVTFITGLLKAVAAVFYGEIIGILVRYGAGNLQGGDAIRQISIWCIALTALGIAVWAFEGLLLMAWVIFGELQAKSVRQRLFTGMLDKDMEWYDLREDGVGSLMIRIETQIRELQLAVSQPLGLFLFEIVGTTASLAIAFAYSWNLTLVILATFPIAVALLSIASAGLGHAIESQKRELSRASKYANAAITSVDTVKSFNGQDHEIWQYLGSIKLVSFYYMKQARVNASQFGITKFMTAVFFVAGFWYGIYLVNKGLPPASAQTTFYSCLNAIFAMESVLPQMLVLTKGMSAGQTLKEILNQMQHGREALIMDGQVEPASCLGDIEFKDVTFSYPSSPEHTILKEANLFFPSGETTFIVGRSGSGKSTIGNLLMKYYEAASGEVLVGGNAIQVLNTNWLRHNINLVQQQSVLFNETIYQNIAFGRRDDTTPREIERAANTACLEDVISELPDGYNTVVGPSGKSLSGGQTQRVMIARSRLRDAPVLILDEATSALDYRGRKDVMNAIREWRQGMTTIIISHDVSQIMDDEYVYVLDNGAIVQEGYRKKLATKSNGTFAAILRDDNHAAQSEVANSSGLAIPGFTPSSSSISHEGNRWTNLTKAITLHGTSNDTIRGANRLSLGISIAQASALRSEMRWSRPLSVEHYLPRGAPQLSLPFVENELGIASKSLSPFSDDYKITTSSSELSADRPNKVKNSRLSVIQSNLPAEPVGAIRVEGHMPTSVKEDSLRTILGSVWPNISHKEKAILVFGFFAALIASAAVPVFGYVQGRLIGTFYSPADQQLSSARTWALVMLGVAFVNGTASFSTHYALEHIGQAWVNSLRTKALTRILAQPKTWFDEEKLSIGRLVDCLDRDAQEMRNLVGRFAGSVFMAIFMLLITVIWSMAISWKLTLTALSSGPVVYAIIVGYNLVSNNWETKCNKAAEVTSSIFTETFSNIRVVRALTLENFFERKHRNATNNTFKVGLSRATYTGLTFGLSDAANFFIISLVFYYGSVLAFSGEITVGQTFQIVNILLVGVGNATATLTLVPQINSSRTTASQMLYLASLPMPASPDTNRTLRLSDPLPIELRRLSFTYPKQNSKILKDVSFNIEAGACTAIVGPSGSGKSTVASLLMGLYLPDSSAFPTLMFHAVPIGSCNIKNLRTQVAIVTQAQYLFPATIFQNIIYGLPETSPYRTLSAAKTAASQAGIHTFVNSLDAGYETLVGEGGQGVSGGQAQRIAIARALVRRPKVLILDEATSALDGESAKQIKDVVRDLVNKGVAVVLVTHSTDMMKAADKLVVIEKGRVVEEGSFERLKRRGGPFARLIGEAQAVKEMGLGLESMMEEPDNTPVEARSRDSWFKADKWFD